MNDIYTRKKNISILLSLLLLLQLTAGCSPLSSNPLCGEWEIAAPEVLARKLNVTQSRSGNDLQMTTEDDDNSRDLPAADLTEAEEAEPKMLLSFSAGGYLRTMTRMGRLEPPPKEGTWELLVHEPATNRMRIKCKIGTQVTEHDVHFIQPDLIELVPPNMAGTNNKVRFSRRK